MRFISLIKFYFYGKWWNFVDSFTGTKIFKYFLKILKQSTGRNDWTFTLWRFKQNLYHFNIQKEHFSF